MKKTAFRLCAIVLVLIMALSCFVGCKGNKATNSKGMYDISKLEKVVAAEMKEVNGRPVIYHNGKPYHYYSMHLRWDHLDGYEDDLRKKLYEEGFKIIKDSGFETVILYINWSKMYDGEKYDFSMLEMHYELASTI